MTLSDDIDINLIAERKPHKDIQIPEEHCLSGKNTFTLSVELV